MELIEKRKGTRIYFLVCMLVSIGLSSFLMIVGDLPFSNSFSSIGATRRIEFALWGMATGFALFIGMKMVLAKLEIDNKRINTDILLSCLLVVMTTLIIGEGELDETRGFAWWWHLVTAVLFSITAFGLMYVLLGIKLKKTNKRSSIPYMILVGLGGAGLIIDAIITGWVTAFTQIMLINTCLLVLLSINFFEPDIKQVGEGSGSQVR